MRPLTTHISGEVLVIVIDDVARVNDSLSDEYRQRVYRASEDHPGHQVALDLGPIDFISSSGVTMLVGLQKRMNAANGKVALFRLQPYVQDVLSQMKLARLFQIVESEVQALETLRSAPSA